MSEVESTHEHKLLLMLSRKESCKLLNCDYSLTALIWPTQLQVNKFLYYHLNQDVYTINLLQGLIVGKCYASTLS